LIEARENILTMVVDVTALDLAVATVTRLANIDKGAYVCVSNVHMCIETYDSLRFRSVVNSADLIIPDGRPIAWAQKLLGHGEAQQVRGPDIMSALCAASSKEGLKIGFYGGSSPESLGRIKTALNSSYPNISIAYAYSPPFRPLTAGEDIQVVSDINAAAVDVLFVGIGCPKQEYWMAEHKDHLHCVMLGVGAAFDYLAGEKNHAPRWMQKIGMEWLFRLCSEPKRLWRRYLSANPRFVWYFLQQWLFGRKF
jgi:N-acetylglucosaminyldiphosphoundecaprenol N-acetyl-beta-D-mannosaminyltransferase